MDDECVYMSVLNLKLSSVILGGSLWLPMLRAV